MGGLLEDGIRASRVTSLAGGHIVLDTQVLVIGAGVIGCSIAYHLARKGAAVTVVDAKGVGTGTSSATLGLVWVQRKEPAEYMELSLLSSRLHAELAKTFDEDVELCQAGGLSTYLDEAILQGQLASMERLNAASPHHQAQFLSAADARKLEPGLSPDILGAIFCPHDGDINPLKLVQAFYRKARQLGVKFLVPTTVNQIIRTDAGVSGVETSAGFIRAAKVVVAAGVNSARLVKTLDIEMPMLFERGQILITEPARKIMTYPTGNSRQTLRGNVLLGTTYESNYEVRTTTAGGAQKIARDSIRRFPALKDTQIIRTFAGIRPLPRDGKPYLGAVERVPGLFVATSHSGVTLSPLHGKVISELIMDGKTDLPIASYRPERFMGVMN